MAESGRWEKAAQQLENRQTAILTSISRLYSDVFGEEFTELEFGQAPIVRRIFPLDESVNSVETDSPRTDSLCEQTVNGALPGLERRESGVLDEESAGQSRAFCEREGDGAHDHPGKYWDERKNGRTQEIEGVEKRLTEILSRAGATFLFKRMPSDYYSRSYEERRDLLSAASVEHLCKSIVMANTQADESVTDCHDRNNSKYYVVVVQYTARLHAQKLRDFVWALNDGKIPKKSFKLRLAPEEESNSLTGFQHNAVTPFGMLTDIPVILSDAIVNLQPEFFWLGGGEVDLKLGIKTQDFMTLIEPFVADCIY